jgi:hypothetical protein
MPGFTIIGKKSERSKQASKPDRKRTRCGEKKILHYEVYSAERSYKVTDIAARDLSISLI